MLTLTRPTQGAAKQAGSAEPINASLSVVQQTPSDPAIDIDLNDPKVQTTAIKIQSLFKKKHLNRKLKKSPVKVGVSASSGAGCGSGGPRQQVKLVLSVVTAHVIVLYIAWTVHVLWDCIACDCTRRSVYVEYSRPYARAAIQAAHCSAIDGVS